MTTHAVIDSALLARGMRQPRTLTCACCGARGLIPEELADEVCHSEIDAIERMHGGSVCTVCAEEHATCQDCQEPIAPGEAYHLHGDPICADCLALERRS